jgi:hypothetical protein
MILHIDSDASYLVQPGAKSRVAGYFYLDNQVGSTKLPHLNGGVLVECKTLRRVVSSAAEAEMGGLFHNAQMGIPIRILLQALGHKQPATPLKTDNATANGFAHNNITQKKSKSWDMNYYWLRDKMTHKEYNIFWESAKTMYADYMTKHHPIKHHRGIRSTYVMDNVVNLLIQVHATPSVSQLSRGCVALGGTCHPIKHALFALYESTVCT